MQNDTPRPEGRRLSRRALIGLGAGAAAVSRAATASAQVRQPPQPSRPLRVPTAELNLVQRVTYGATVDDVALAYAHGFNGYINWQLDPSAIDDAACDARLAVYTSLGRPTAQLYALESAPVLRELIEAAIIRAIYSRRQLFERIVEFWNDHLNTNINTVGIYKLADDRDVIRRNAFGTFAQLLNGSAASPAMLIYLNNAQSTRTAPNQNYARELMELHTLGVQGGYTQQDIVEVARCFTGWRYNGNTSDERAGTFFYDSTRHDNNAKTVLGVPIPAGGGMNDGLTVLRILAEHPSTARFVSRKLLRWLLRYDPQAALVGDVAWEFQRTGGDIKAVLRRILSYEELRWAPPLFKRPGHLIVSALRAMNVNVTTASTLRSNYFGGMGHSPFNWLAPNGYPQSFEYWGGLPLLRWNFCAALANGSITGALPDITALLNGATTAVQIADRIDAVVFAGEMPRADKTALLAYLRPDPVATSRMRDAFGLALGSPGFQWY